MQKSCYDSYFTTFGDYGEMLEYHQKLTKSSEWAQTPVRDLEVEPLAMSSPLFGNLSSFATGTSLEAVADTAANLGLAIRVNGELYPARDTAYKSLLDRAKIGGTALPKLGRDVLANVLNACLKLFGADALVLIRDEKVTAVHSGDTVDYSVLPIDALLDTLQEKLNDRFPGNQFKNGYSDHAITSAEWTMPTQKEDLLGAYTKMLDATGHSTMAKKLVPGVRFSTSDAGIASAKVSAMLMGAQYPILIGGCISVDHRHQSTVADFTTALDQLFAQYGDNIERLMRLQEIELEYPVNAMTRVCKKFSMPKKAAMEAIAMYEMAYGSGPATAHDVFIAMQEIPFILKTEKVPESKILTLQENMARALTIKWSDFDLAKAVSY